MGGCTSSMLPGRKARSVAKFPTNLPVPQPAAAVPGWKPAPFPKNEDQRLSSVKSYQLLDELGGDLFDVITTLVSVICNVRYSAISIIDTNRQYFFSEHGLGCHETSRDAAFCAHAILDPTSDFVVSDTLQDDRFCKNPLVTGGPLIRSYHGIPLVTPGGQALGTLCAIDVEPKKLTAAQRKAVALLARQVMVQLELRKYARRAQAGHLGRKERAKLAANMVRLLQLFPTSNPRLANSLASTNTSMQDFVTILTDGEGLLLLLRELTEEFSLENLFFWQAVEDYRACPDLELAVGLHRVYVASNAMFKINISSQTSGEINEALKQPQARAVQGKELPKDQHAKLQGLFDVAQLEVYSLIFFDSFTRLQRTADFEQYRERCEARQRARERKDQRSSFRARLGRLSLQSTTSSSSLTADSLVIVASTEKLATGGSPPAPGPAQAKAGTM